MCDPIIKAIKPGYRYHSIFQVICIPEITKARQVVSDNQYWADASNRPHLALLLACQPPLLHQFLQ